MRRFLIPLFALFVLVTASPCHPLDAKNGQIIVSVTESWNDYRGKIYLFERKGDAWKPVGRAIETVVGRFGLAWDQEVKSRAPGEPVKAEGDLKAPAGIFPITLAMGDSPLPPDGVTLLYRPIRHGTHCVDDPASSYYNRIVEEGELPATDGHPWKSSERMWEIKDIYRQLLVVGYNTNQPKPGAGSCIFMHIRRPSGDPTYGCTAVSEGDMTRIMQWLKPGEYPSLVQFPRDVYSRLWKEWRLPSPALIREDTAERPFPLVDVQKVAPGVNVDMRYAKNENFTGKKVYTCGRCFLRPATAVKLAAAQRELKKQGLSLKMWDCYRPLSVQKIFWSLVPDPRYVADPKTGSRHNRGNAVDVTLVDESGKEVEMPTGFDDFTSKAGHGEMKLPRRAMENRRTLAEAMEKAGFRRLESEWWHYDDGEAGGDVMDIPFAELCR
jgi:D-alanyl-D-alanine dipeptidase/L,D-peptidoglycan transpeptidase YkuD (ErfK/YbiS/YcfS/YnhG family)